MMDTKLKAAFSQIRAEEELKDSTRAFLAEKTQGYTGKAKKKRRGFALAACAACLLLLLLGGSWFYLTPTATISIDINPSVELGVNRFDRVVSVTGFNEDGRKLTETLEIRFKNYADAVELILNSDKIENLLARGELMEITVTGPDEDRSAQILSGVETCTAGRENTCCHAAQPEEVASAHEAGLSCGKYRAFLEAQELDPDLQPEAVQGMTMKEIRELIARLSDERESSEQNGESSSQPPQTAAGAPQNSSSCNQGNGSGQGNGNGQGNGRGNGNGHGKHRFHDQN